MNDYVGPFSSSYFHEQCDALVFLLEHSLNLFLIISSSIVRVVYCPLITVTVCCFLYPD